jgi:hypothetical protein
MKSALSAPITLGGAERAGVRLIVWCKACGHRARTSPCRDGSSYMVPTPRSSIGTIGSAAPSVTARNARWCRPGRERLKRFSAAGLSCDWRAGPMKLETANRAIKHFARHSHKARRAHVMHAPKSCMRTVCQRMVARRLATANSVGSGPLAPPPLGPGHHHIDIAAAAAGTD